jgi:hypothetical protein
VAKREEGRGELTLFLRGKNEDGVERK